MLRSSLVLAALLATTASAQLLTAVPIQSVHIDDPFWSPKYDIWRTVTVPDCLDKFERDGVLENFDHVARGELTAKHRGMPWFDGLTYEMITACADLLAQHPDPALRARLDNYIGHIAAAGSRDPDGYLNTYTQLKEPNHRWGQNGGNDRWQHDLYNAGCLVEAAVHYYRATGDTKLLATAIRAANGMCKVMGPPPRANIIPGHAIGEESLTRLYELFVEQPKLKETLAAANAPVHEADYLALAKFWIDARGHHDGRTDFGAYDQDAQPALDQQTIEGHAVRAALFASGMTAVGLAAGDARYTDTAQRLWQNMVGRRMYVTGGIGSFANDEKFGPDYVLPNDGYLETCAAAANAFLQHNLNRAFGNAATADELERVLYNNALAGVSLAGNRYFYMNPLQCSPARTRWNWHECPCCPPMFLKLMGALPGYIYASDANGAAYVNLFIGSRANLTVGGAKVSLTQTTHYPWSGDIRLNVSPAQPTTFDLNIRIPGWARTDPWTGGLYRATPPPAADAFTITVNGQPIDKHELVRGGYAKLRREWRAGDVVELKLAMPVQRVRADDRVAADRNRVALQRGPLIYCLESADNTGRVRDLILPDDAAITTEDRPDLLGHVALLRAAKARRLTADEAEVQAEITAIPYYANANRGPVEMQTWIATTASAAVAPTIAALAKASASHCFANDTLGAMGDGITPKNSADGSRLRFTWWDHRGSAEWVQYDFDQPRDIRSVDVYWWDDTPKGGRCRAPKSWRLLYKTASGAWAPVPGSPKFETTNDRYNTATFDAIRTSALRIEAQLEPNFSAGILQWRVNP
jgi:DUF1680 family protein